jgi:two-component system NtrC family sensor kinase
MKTEARYIILFSILLLYLFAAYTQTQWVDSVKKVLSTQKEDTNKVTTLINLSGAYRFSYPDSGLVYAQKALSLAEKLNKSQKGYKINL